MAEKNTTRIDKWLFAMRIFKTRTLATQACTGGKVKIDGKRIKASRMIRTGDIIQARKGVIKYEYEVLKIAEKRMGAKMVTDFMNDTTSLEELEKLKTTKIIFTPIKRKGKGRPTKKERRIIDQFKKNTK